MSNRRQLTNDPVAMLHRTAEEILKHSDEIVNGIVDKAKVNGNAPDLEAHAQLVRFVRQALMEQALKIALEALLDVNKDNPVAIRELGKVGKATALEVVISLDKKDGEKDEPDPKKPDGMSFYVGPMGEA